MERVILILLIVGMALQLYSSISLKRHINREAKKALRYLNDRHQQKTIN